MKELQPNNHRISNSLFESIRQVTSAKIAEAAPDNAGAAVDRAHFCATHVEHALLGQGTCISEQHAEPDADGNIAWYSVEFPSGIQRVETSNLKIVEGKSHTHGKKMAEETNEEPVDEALVGNQHKIDANKNNKIDAHDFQLLRGKKKTVEEGNDGNLANNAKPYDKVTHGDVISGRLGKDEMGGKKKVKEAAAPKRSAGSVFDKNVAAQYMKSTPGEKAGFTSKKISTGTVYNKKLEKEKPVKEGVTQTIINYNDFVLEVTDNPTYGDYLKALQSMVESRDENIQQEVVAIATEAYNEKIDSIIAEAKARITFEPKFQALRESGATILDENFVIESNNTYVEYTVDKDNIRTHYVHTGTVEKK